MKTLKLFRNGDSQAVRLTKEFRFEGNEVIARKVGNLVVLSAKKITYEDALAAVNRFKGVIRRKQPTGYRSDSTGRACCTSRFKRLTSSVSPCTAAGTNQS